MLQTKPTKFLIRPSLARDSLSFVCCFFTSFLGTVKGLRETAACVAIYHVFGVMREHTPA